MTQLSFAGFHQGRLRSAENLATCHTLNHDRYRAFAAAPGTAPVDGKLRPSAFAYDGPAFKGLGIDNLDKTAQG